MPFSLIPFMLLIIPILEIAVFITVGGQIGVLWTFALILLTAVMGTILLRIQGFQIVNKLREESNAGRIPGKELGHGAMILVAGVLLLTPGFVTDTVGFSLFLPPVRSLIWSFVASRVKFMDPTEAMRNGGGPFSANRGHEEGVVELDPDEFEDLSKNDTPNESSPWRGKLSDKNQNNEG